MSNSTTITAPPQLYEQVIAVIYLLLSIYVIVTNLLELTIVAMIKKTSSTIYIASLSLTDLLMGIFSILPSSVSFLIDHNDTFFLGDILCDVTGLVTNTTLFASLLAVIAITLNRYIALVTPLQYKKISTNKIALIVTGFSWLFSILRSLVPYYMGDRYEFWKQLGMCSYSTATLFAELEVYVYPILLVIPYSICYVLLVFSPIHMIILLSRRQIKSAPPPTQTTHQQGSFSMLSAVGSLRTRLPFSGGTTKQRRSRGRQHERDATTTTLLVVVGFVVCYAIHYFFIIYYFLYLLLGDFPFSISDRMYEVLETFWMLGINMNSSINPVIYLFRNTAFKTELMNMKQAALRTCCNRGEGGVPHKVMKRGTSNSGSTSYNSRGKVTSELEKIYS